MEGADGYVLAVWNADGYAYAVSVTKKITKDEMVQIVEMIVKNEENRDWPSWKRGMIPIRRPEGWKRKEFVPSGIVKKCKENFMVYGQEFIYNNNRNVVL